MAEETKRRKRLGRTPATAGVIRTTKNGLRIYPSFTFSVLYPNLIQPCNAMKIQYLLSSVVFTSSLAAVAVRAQAQTWPDRDIMFVTQVPPAKGHNTILSIDGNLLATTEAAPRGGELMMAYHNPSNQAPTIKSLTLAAGLGIDGPQQKGSNAIAVRDPHIHFSGTKALVSIAKGAPSTPSEDGSLYRWQIYEVTGLGRTETPVFTKVPNQHAEFNNVQPAYLPNGKIVYATDCPVNEQKHLYPALDEDGLGPAGTGLWVLDPTPGTQPKLFTHATSGAAEPFVDSYGRVMFTRWDVLQRDKLATSSTKVLHDYQTEDPAATYGGYSEVFPEPLQSTSTPFGLSFDVFMPWTVNQDGGGLNTLNHLGRHELSLNFPRSGPDAGMVDFTSNDFTPGSGASSLTRAGSFFQLSEHPTSPGRYVATDVVSTSVSGGRLVHMVVTPTTNPDLVSVTVQSSVGLARDPSWTSRGNLMGSWMQVSSPASGSSYGAPAPAVNPDTVPTGTFAVRIAVGNNSLDQGTNLTIPTNRTVVQYVNGTERTVTGPLHQLQPVEVIPRTVPPTTSTLTTPVDTPEASMYIRNGVSPSGLQTWLQTQNKALMVVRNITTRDAADRQQPFSLQVANGGVSSLVPGVTAKTVERVQFFQGQYLRAYSGNAVSAPDAGRRITAREMTAAAMVSNPPANGPDGSVPIAPDGSVAAFVPAGRAMTWQTMDPNHNAVVRERYWLNFKAGELRVCTSCHAVNTLDQTGKPVATNSPEALNTLLAYWKSTNPASDAQKSSYKVWSELKLHDATGATAQADDDKDGLTNLQEFVYGSDPLVPNKPTTADVHPLTAVSASPAGITLKFTRNKDATGTEVVAESSSDLTNWQETARVNDAGSTSAQGSTLQETSSASQSNRRLAEYTLTVSAESDGPKFFRLRFVVP
jgi:hypothetical protein